MAGCEHRCCQQRGNPQHDHATIDPEHCDGCIMAAGGQRGGDGRFDRYGTWPPEIRNAPSRPSVAVR
jgi:hypothetical protein